MLFSGCNNNNFTDDMKNHSSHHHQELSGDDQTKRSKKNTSISDLTTKTLTKTTGDGATIEVARRPRGRPPGSKNKPKPPLIITRDSEPPPAAMRTHILEISTGHDIVDAIASFARRRSIGLCVLAGSGSVSNVTLRQPMQTPATAIVLRGRFEILSLSGSMLPPSLPTMQGGVSVSLAGPQGQVIGGMVAGPLLASGTVVVVAAGFENPTFTRLPDDNDNDGDDNTAVDVSTGGEGCEADAHHHHHHHHHQHQQQHHHNQHHRHEHELNAPPAESCGMTMYGSDPIWAPTPRPPQPPPASRY
ncbi:AT-hook motif nuclear-localized protein 17-like [Dioscorea cayenensis subsp. rotundata]|uniref:AT-hook motif nuclear-localized protein 17-like n=1 Tax=Dioscorea cayennensis subsp. rotundata TaxID=55577 RepID=A0AB40CWN7_DIOCR|nr:AT-hook motif nuclear-localized protein 17-like [Dioscorea cayenensis subsp. rotundata]